MAYYVYRTVIHVLKCRIPEYLRLSFTGNRRIAVRVRLTGPYSEPSNYCAKLKMPRRHGRTKRRNRAGMQMAWSFLNWIRAATTLPVVMRQSTGVFDGAVGTEEGTEEGTNRIVKGTKARTAKGAEGAKEEAAVSEGSWTVLRAFLEAANPNKSMLLLKFFLAYPNSLRSEFPGPKQGEPVVPDAFKKLDNYDNRLGKNQGPIAKAPPGAHVYEPSESLNQAKGTARIQHVGPPPEKGAYGNLFKETKDQKAARELHETKTGGEQTLYVRSKTVDASIPKRPPTREEWFKQGQVDKSHATAAQRGNELTAENEAHRMVSNAYPHNPKAAKEVINSMHNEFEGRLAPLASIAFDFIP